MALVAAVVVPVPQASPLEPTPGYPTIQRAFLQEEFELVATLAQTFIEQNPDVPEASRVGIWLALSLDRLQRSHEALKELDRVKGRLDPGDPLWPEVLFWEGDVSRRALQMIRAKLAYRQLLERYPASTWASQAQLGLGFIYLHQQAFESAIGYFHEVTLRQVGTPVALDALLFTGVCHLQLQQFKEAAEVFELLLGQLQDPTVVAQAAFYLGEGLSGLGRYEDAVLAYQRALAHSVKTQWGHLAQFGLGWAYYRVDRCDESVEAFERYLKPRGGDDHRTEALFAQGSCLMKLGREQDALSRFEQIVSHDPGHPLAVESGFVIVDASWREERLTPAKELLHTLLRWQLDRASRAKVHLRLGAIALEQGNAAQARTVFALAGESDEPSIQQAALTGLGNVQMFLGDLTAAKQFYEEAIQVSDHTPQADQATYQLGRIHLQVGALEEAIDVFQRLTASTDAALADDARLALVIAYLNRHEEGLARPLLDLLRQERPPSAVARAAYYEALLALGEGNEAAAQQLCEQAIANAPRTDEAFEARLLLADLQARETSVREAMEWLQRVSASERLPRGRRAKLAKRLGDFARSEQAYVEAIRWYEEAARLLPSLSGEAGYRMASCYEEAGDIEVAMRWYQAIDQPLWRVRGQLAAAKLLERQDRRKEAEAIYLSLAEEPIPEAKVVRERLAALRGDAAVDTDP
jgi:tetratricopeptide (TPR) repeat protein